MGLGLNKKKKKKEKDFKNSPIKGILKSEVKVFFVSKCNKNNTVPWTPSPLDIKIQGKSQTEVSSLPGVTHLIRLMDAV